MNILLTNDDGIGSEGLQKLARHLRLGGKHRVFVIAPDTDRSGISHALAVLNGPLKIAGAGEDTWTCSGYPADCVIAGLNGALPVRPCLVLSGINRGANLGTDIIYSGTASAARQSSLSGTPAVALSLAGGEPFCWDMAVSWAADHLEEFLAYWRKDSFVNVNIPNSSGGPDGMIAAWPAAKKYRDTLSITTAPDGSRLCSMKFGEDTTPQEKGSDCEVVSRNYASVSAVSNYPAVLRELCPGAPDYSAVAMRT